MQPTLWTAGLCATLLATAACGVALAQTATTPPSTTRPPTATVAPRNPAIGNAIARPPRPGGVNWAAAVGSLRQTQGGAMRPGPRMDTAAVDRTAIPILLPTDPALMAAARIYSFGTYYSISSDLPGAGVSLTGTTVTVPLAKATPMKVSPAAEQLVVQRTVDGQLLSFVRFGVLYTVEIRCDAPADPRCRTDAFARGLYARSTAVLMGKAARQAAGLGG